MKALNRIILIVLLCFFSAGAYISYSASCAPDLQKKNAPETIKINNKYKISIDYNEKQHTAKASETVIFQNQQKNDLKDIALHLFANAYKNEAAVPVIGTVKNSFPDGFNPGYMKVSNAKVDGKTVKYRIDNMIMTLELNQPVKPGSSISISMDFELKLPIARTRLGSYGGVSQFAYWYPVLAVYEQGWMTRQYNRIGESNYSDVADYEVSLCVPAEDQVAATGDIISESAVNGQNGKKKIVIVKAENVRDFAWVCSKDFVVEETTAEGVRIKNYYLKKNEKTGSKADEYAASVLKYYNSVFGKYPYKTLSVVNTYLYGGGMEYPQLLSLGQSLYESEAKLQHGVAHEGAHQWWYVTVGNDEYRCPWLDEGLAVYSTEMYTAYNSKDGSYLKKTMDGYRAAWKNDLPVTSSVDKFTSWSSYNTVSYKMGAAALDELRKKIGDEMFIKVMSSYYHKYAFKNADTQDFIETISQVAGEKAAVDFYRLISSKK